MPVWHNVLLLTPSHKATPDALYAFCLAETKAMGLQNGVNFLPLIWPGESILQHARASLLASAIENQHIADVIWIDDDMGWEPSYALRLLSHKVDVVGGTARRKEDVETYVVNCDPDKLAPGPNGLIKDCKLGLGFTRWSRKACVSLWRTGGKYRDGKGRELSWCFDVRPVDGELISEDIHAHRKLAELGFEIYLDPNITCQHVGRKVWAGDFNRWMHEFQQARKQELGNVVCH